MKRIITGSFDGACEPNNPGGIATYGYVIQSGGQVLSAGRGVVGEGPAMTNNVAEYQGLIKMLEGIREVVENGDDIEVEGDSQLVIRQMTGQYKVKSTRIVNLQRRAKKLVLRLRGENHHVRFKWVERELNSKADTLSHQAFEEYCKERGYVFIPCKCGGTMVPKRNSKTGHRFMGCSRFPVCRRTTAFHEPE